jgi:hypothetical protein
MSDPQRLLEHIRRIRAELDELEQLVRADDAPTVHYVEPVTDGEIIFEDGGNFEIIGGLMTSKFPDCCAVGNDKSYYCTGTLIAPTLVITAKHCKGSSRIFFGKDINHPEAGETINIRQNIPHPDPSVDIRVLVLERAAQAIPRHVAQGAEIGNPHTAIVAGYGTTNLAGTQGYGIKRYARVPIMSLDSALPADQQQYGSHANMELVAGHLGLHRDTCRGDSGGPLYIADPNGNGYFLLGATSRGTKNAEHVCGDGGIYVRVDTFLDWIRAATAIHVDGPLP